MMFCQSCGGMVPDGSRFCNHCGRPMQPPSMGAPPMGPPMMAAQGYGPGGESVTVGMPGFQMTVHQSGGAALPPVYQQPPQTWGAPPPAEQRPCGFCHGSGQHPMNFSAPCPTCGGTGSNLIPPGSIPCARCSGEGNEPFDLSKPCQVCGGKGVAVVR